jgi:predicted kinase
VTLVNSTSSIGARPRIIVITGEPGSGKSTLGAELAKALRLPFLARDDIRGGLFMTEGAWSDAPHRVPTSEHAVESLLRIVETTAGLGVSCVVEYVVREERVDDLERMQAVADCVVLMTECRDAPARFARRNRGDRLLNRQPVLDLLGHRTIDDHTDAALERMEVVAAEMRTAFDLPTMRVDTDTADGYEPQLEHIIDFVVADHHTE